MPYISTGVFIFIYIYTMSAQRRLSMTCNWYPAEMIENCYFSRAPYI